MLDIVLPNKNEKALAIQATRIGIDELIFARSFKSINEVKAYTETLKDIAAEIKGIKLKMGRLIDVKRRSDLKKQPFDSSFAITIAVSDGSEEINRWIFESKVNAAINISTSTGREHMHYRQSGVNQVLAKLAAENNVAYCLNFAKLLELNSWKRVTLLGRWMQNLRIFNKYKAKTEIYSFASSPDTIRNMNDLEAFKKILSR